MTDDLAFEHLFTILRRRRRTVVVFALVGTVAAAAVGAWLPPRYTADALLIVQFPSANASGQTSSSSSATGDAVVQTHVAALEAPDYLSNVLASLADDPEIKAALNADHERHLAGGTLAHILARAERPLVPTFAKDAWHSLLGGQHEQTTTGLASLNQEDLKRRLNVMQVQGSNVIAVRVTWSNPRLAAAVANRAVRLYSEREEERTRGDIVSEISAMEPRIREERAAYERANAAVEAYRTAHALTGQNRTEAFDQQVTELEGQLVSAQIDLVARKSKLARARELARRPAQINAGEFADAPALAELRHEELALVQSESELATSLGPSHPRMQAITSQLREIQSKLSRELGRVIQSREADEHSAEVRVGELQARLAAAHRARGQAKEDSYALADLEREATTRRQTYESLQQRRRELAETRDTVARQVRILSLAKPPVRPSFTPILLIPPSIIAFTALGGLIAVVRDRLDRTIRGERDVLDALGVPCLSFIPRLPASRRITPHRHLARNPLSPYAEAIRSLAAATDLARLDAHGKVVLVSSSLPAEGKTTLAISIAVYAATLGQRVLLMDLDGRCPSVMREVRMQVEDAVPLSPPEAPRSEAIKHIPALGVDYLAMRSRALEPLLPFSGDTLPRFISSLRGEYHCIVLDGPPVLIATQARMLAKLADKILFVVKWGNTTRDAARTALGLLAAATTIEKVFGAVVMQVDLKRHAKGRYGGLPEYFDKYSRYYADNGRSASLTRTRGMMVSMKSMMKKATRILFLSSRPRCKSTGTPRRASG